MGKYFGTDGFRGEANVRLKAEHAFRIGRYIGWYFGQDRKARIVIGQDTRISGDMLTAAISSGIVASGGDAWQMQVTTTPSVAYAVREDGFDCGVMISASHNPYYDNGIKLIGGGGRKIDGAVEEQIEAYLDGALPELPCVERGDLGRIVPYEEGRTRYLAALQQIPEKPFAGLRIGLDCANGSTSALAEPLFRALGTEPYVICSAPDGININRDCGSTHIEALQEAVRAHGLAAGFAFDGDGDRCFAVDETGAVIDGDLIMYVCAKYLRQQDALRHDLVVTTVMSNLGLHKSLEREGIRTEQTPVGDKYVSARMDETGACLGGEQSGHIIFGEHATTGDGMLTALMVLRAMQMAGRPLSQLAGEMKVYPQLLQNVRVEDKAAAMHHPAVEAAIASVREELGENGRILVRESGTEPVIRVMVEAETDALCGTCVGRVVTAMRQEGLVLE